jgi:hypothetical protein
MSLNKISLEDADLLIRKLMSESIPVVAYMVCADGSHCKLKGSLDSVTQDTGVIVAGTQGKPAESSNLALVFGKSDNLEIFFGDKREIPSDSREELAKRFGDTALTFRVRSSGAMLTLFFNS